MPNLNEINQEIQSLVNSQVQLPQALSEIRNKYLSSYHQKVGRNVIVYYSGWINSPYLNQKNSRAASIIEKDMHALMLASNKLDRSLGLDLFLHTPGGSAAVAECIVNYLRKLFSDDIRAIVPQLAMSAGTMIALSCKEIVMGKQSSLGPIDPQINGIAAEDILADFRKAKEEISQDPKKQGVWYPILQKYSPGLLQKCQQNIDLSKNLVSEWLSTNMYKFQSNTQASDIKRIVDALTDTEELKIHGRHLPLDYCRKIGIKVENLEDDQDLQDKVLSIHHALTHTFSSTRSIKIVQNQLGMIYSDDIK
jgi:ATP-dependent protease ClpP protease subunit